MENVRIIYPQENGVVAIVVPVNENLTLDDIVQASVPSGVPYKVVDVADIPTDRTFRDAWEYVE